MGLAGNFTDSCPQGCLNFSELPPAMLTRLKIESIKPLLKRQRLFDGRGLYLEIAPSGGRWWRFKYRFERKEKRISLGVYPAVGIKDARERCDEARKQLAAGISAPNERAKDNVAKRILGAADMI